MNCVEWLSHKIANLDADIQQILKYPGDKAKLSQLHSQIKLIKENFYIDCPNCKSSYPLSSYLTYEDDFHPGKVCSICNGFNLEKIMDILANHILAIVAEPENNSMRYKANHETVHRENGDILRLVSEFEELQKIVGEMLFYPGDELLVDRVRHSIDELKHKIYVGCDVCGRDCVSLDALLNKDNERRSDGTCACCYKFDAKKIRNIFKTYILDDTLPSELA
jgi:hypothetical protein